MEVWKDIRGYEGIYQVSNLGRVYSYPKKGRHNGKILKPGLTARSYLTVSLWKDNKNKTYPVHQLVAICFLNHVPNGHDKIVDHINNNKVDNRLENIQIVSNRVNSSKDQFRKNRSSIYAGVNFDKKTKKWRAQAYINGRSKFIGLFTNEYDAHLAYQNKIKEI